MTSDLTTMLVLQFIPNDIGDFMVVVVVRGGGKQAGRQGGRRES